MVAVMSHVRDLTALVRAIDPGLDERLLEGLVTLERPLRKEPFAS